MGMYTELYLECKIDVSKMSDIEKDIITYMFDKSEEITPTILPGGELFKCYRWDMIGRGHSAYFQDDVDSKLIKENNIWYIVNRCDFKNYDNEIQLFLKWVKPYIVKNSDKQCIGYHRGEDFYEKTDIYV